MLRIEASGGRRCTTVLAISKANALEQELRDQEGDTQLLYLHRAVPTSIWCARKHFGQNCLI